MSTWSTRRRQASEKSYTLYAAEFLMERMMLRAIKRRAQRSNGSYQATEQAGATASG